MKDCEPRDWPHLPDSRANERPHWIIPHNASGTKAQQLTLERKREMKRGWGGGRGCKQLWLTAGQEAACSHTQLTHTYKTKACGTGITPSVLSLRSLSLDSSQPLLLLPSLSPSLPFSLSRALSQEDLKYQYPFLLDIAFSLQSAFCCPFIVKTSGEIPCRNILSNAALPASNGPGH